MTIANFTRRLIQLTLGPLLLFGGLAGTGCSQETAESDDEVSSTDSRLDFETYRASLKQESEGLYVVDDMLLDLQRLEEYFALRYPAPNALVVRKSNATRTIWTDPARSDLAWCVSNDFGSNQDKVVTAMQAATKGWQTEAGAGLVFRYASAQNGNCNTDNTNVRIAVVLDSSMTDAYGKSPVGPPTTGRQFTQIRLSPAALSAWDLDVAS